MLSQDASAWDISVSATGPARASNGWQRRDADTQTRDAALSRRKREFEISALPQARALLGAHICARITANCQPVYVTVFIDWQPIWYIRPPHLLRIPYRWLE